MASNSIGSETFIGTNGAGTGSRALRFTQRRTGVDTLRRLA